jgi:hypothetical protein
MEASSVGKYVRGQRKRSEVLGAFGLLDVTMLRPVLAWRRFETYETFIYLIFQFFPGRGELRILNQGIWGHACSFKNNHHIFTDISESNHLITRY